MTVGRGVGGKEQGKGAGEGQGRMRGTGRPTSASADGPWGGGGGTPNLLTLALDRLASFLPTVRPGWRYMAHSPLDASPYL